MAEGASGPGGAGCRRHRDACACERRVVSANDRHQVSIRSLSRRRTGDAGSRRRPDRHDVRSIRQLPAAGAGRCDQGFRGNGTGTFEPGAGCAHRRRGGTAGILHGCLAWHVGAEGHAEGNHRQAQRRDRGSAGRSEGAPALCRDRAGDPAARPADPGGPRRVSKGEAEKW